MQQVKAKLNREKKKVFHTRGESSFTWGGIGNFGLVEAKVKGARYEPPKWVLWEGGRGSRK